MRWLAAWVLYGLGDFAARLENAFFGRWEFTSIYPLYNALMIASENVQGPGPGPWLDPVENAVRVAKQATEKE